MILLLKNFYDTVGNRTRDLPSCSAIFATVAAHVFKIEKHILCFQYFFCNSEGKGILYLYFLTNT